MSTVSVVRRVEFSALTGSFLVMHGREHAHSQVLTAIALALSAELHLPAEQTHAAAGPRSSERAVTSATRRDDIAWHVLPAEMIEQRLGSSGTHGLQSAQAHVRLRDGTNALPLIAQPSLGELLWRQVGNLPTGLLGASALVSIATGGAADAVAIAAVVAINALIGLRTESEAERVIRSLNVGAPRAAHVIRDGSESEIPLESVVPGELLTLSSGTYVAADARLVASDSLSVDESALTGESLPVFKEPAPDLSPDTVLAERRNMVYRGTIVTGGTGRALVVATGPATELGVIQASAVSVSAPATPLHEELVRTGTKLVKLSAAACGVVLLLGLARGMPWLGLMKLAISLGVAAVPEGLPAVATSTLALGVGRMRRRGVAVRRLGAIEALGALDTLCFDKTGTLTQNHMRVECVLVGIDFPLPMADGALCGAERPPELQRLVQIVALCNDATVGESGTLSGSATEGALVEFAHRCGAAVIELRRNFPRLDALYRSEGRRYMVTSHRLASGSVLVAAKGSPVELLERSHWVLEQGQLAPLAPESRAVILRRNDELAARGLRILGVAYSEMDASGDPAAAHLTWLGLVAMSDPPRPGVAAVVSRLHEAGVRPIMITGDQAATAAGVGEQLGLAKQGPLRIVESRDASKLDPQLLGALAERAHVFARATPSLKLSIVRALQQRGRLVGMTGDGVNDGPALRAANVGIAMGRAQQDVARSIADIVLENDDLDAVLAAIAEGRTVYDNVRKAIRYLLATNFSEIQTILAALALGFPAPLNPMQLLWLNLLTDIFPALGLALEPAEPDVLHTSPRDPRQPLLGGRDTRRLLRESLLLSGATLGSYWFGTRRYGVGPQASTLAFATLTLAQLLHALTCRSERAGVLESFSRPRNRVLDASLLGTIAIQVGSLFMPWTRRLLGTSRLGVVDLGTIVAFSIAPLVMNEMLNRAARERRAGSAVSGGHS